MTNDKYTLLGAFGAAVAVMAAAIKSLFHFYRKAMEARIRDLREEREREHDDDHHREHGNSGQQDDE